MQVPFWRHNAKETSHEIPSHDERPRGTGDWDIFKWPRKDIEAHLAYWDSLNHDLHEAGELVSVEALSAPAEAKRVRADKNGLPVTVLDYGLTSRLTVGMAVASFGTVLVGPPGAAVHARFLLGGSRPPDARVSRSALLRASCARRVDRTEWLAVLYVQAGLGLPLLRGFVVIEPYVRLQHTFSDDRSSSEFGFDVTFPL